MLQVMGLNLTNQSALFQSPERHFTRNFLFTSTALYLFLSFKWAIPGLYFLYFAFSF